MNDGVLNNKCFFICLKSSLQDSNIMQGIIFHVMRLKDEFSKLSCRNMKVDH